MQMRENGIKEGRRQIAGRSVRWDQGRAEAAYTRGLWVRETLADALARAVREQPGRVLVVEGDVRLDARTLYERATALAQVLTARFPPGSVISFMLPNWHEAAEIYMAATMAGLVVNPVLPSLRDHDLIFMLPDVGSRMMFIPAEFRGYDYAAMMARIVGELALPPEVVVVRGEPGQFLSYLDLFKQVPDQPLPELEPDAVRMIMYTSGTTGSPKGVMHSHNSIHALVQQIRMNWLVDPGDRFLVPSPISHIGGSIYAFEFPLLLGTTTVLMDRWNADDGARLMTAEGITHMAGATPFLEQLLEATRRLGTRLPALKLFTCGGASVPPSLVRDAAAYFEKAVVTRVYGSTEVPLTTIGVMDHADVDHAAETEGRACIAEVRLCDEQGNVAELGEIRARGPQMLLGYVHEDQEATVFDADGFYRTGDVGHWVDDDYLVVGGRIKDIIIRNGENIAPKEVEDLLVEHPAIAEIAIVGLPDPRTGETACAVIVPAGPEHPDVPALREFLDAKRVAKFKIPEQVAIWESLPKNEAGKVLKQHIRDALIAAASKNAAAG
jgi:acyl-CoA synthetase (AMP-forming)/AMP-acid ligase II